MTGMVPFDRPVEALQRAQAYWEERHGLHGREGDTVAALTLALEREPGTPAEEVAREVAARLSWTVYDHELLELVALEQGVPVRLVDSLDERGKHWLMECLEGLGHTAQLSEAAYLRRLVRVIQSLAARGRCILVGHGAAEVLLGPATLRILLVGAPEDRIARLMRRHGLNWQEAARRAEEMTRERTRFIREHFGRDPQSPQNFDLVLNTSHWPPAACAALIVQAVERKAAGPALG